MGTVVNGYLAYKAPKDFVEVSLDEKLSKKIIDHRDNSFLITRGKYMEMLPSQFILENCPDSLDWYKVETSLMFNYLLAVGLNKDNRLVVLGYITNDQTETNPMNYIFPRRLTHDDIQFVIPEEERKEGYLEIVPKTCETEGNFVVIRNKGLNLVPDIAIINQYAHDIAEIEGSRYSLEVQSKVMKIFRGRVGSVTVDNAVEAVFNGAPVLKASADFEPEDIMEVGSSSAVNMLISLIDISHTRRSELETELGIPNLGVDKESGVSNAEATANDSKTDNVAEIKLKTRESGIKLLNARLIKGLHILDKELKVVMRNDRTDSGEEVKDGYTENSNNTQVS